MMELGPSKPMLFCAVKYPICWQARILTAALFFVTDGMLHLWTIRHMLHQTLQIIVSHCIYILRHCCTELSRSWKIWNFKTSGIFGKSWKFRMCHGKSHGI